MRLGTGLVALMCLAEHPRAFAAAEPVGGPEFREVYELVRSNLAGVSEAELNRAAVQGFISALNPKVSLVTNGVTSSATMPDSRVLADNTVYDKEIAYLRIGRVGEGLAKALLETFQKVSATNKIKGLVLDLRYANGSDYAEAAKTADLFANKERPLLSWGAGMVPSKEKNDAIGIPIAVLVNGQTARAAEALAAVMREIGAALILGSRTAGEATIGQEFTLADGKRLRVATAAIQLGDGAVLSADGIKPDINVQVNAEDERAYYADAFRALPKPNLGADATLTLTNTAGVTNRVARRPRLNEAELVRERREGTSHDTELASPRDNPFEVPIVHDPVLSRSIDLLKGLAVVRQSRF
jgi:C-terminal processing protease CtpA/Prc